MSPYLFEHRVWMNRINGNQADEVEVFGLFGGDLPVMHQSREPDFAENGWVTVHTTRRWVQDINKNTNECARRALWVRARENDVHS
ncbi:hypothetical protein [Paenibacillus sp. DCT19]|uniref:hypothetical protein n=1 Tax=Paenibacillus sp. DCT19 TaxID=2211212 RepID=UPI000FE1C0C6|nr:hypothetical protein [Paenibacillus sp. DCT19]